MADGPERHALGKVSDVRTISAGRGPVELHMWIEMNGRTTFFQPYSWDEDARATIKPGTQVDVDYKLGHSGSVYIDRIVPTGKSENEHALMGHS